MDRPRATHLCGLLALASLVLGACARYVPPRSFEGGGDAGFHAYRVAEVDLGPKLIKCAEHGGPPPSTISGGRWEFVTVGFIVTESGTVDNNSIFIKSTGRSARHPDASEKSIADAKVIALSCEYEPGTIAGQPVRVSTERTFRILAAM